MKSCNYLKPYYEKCLKAFSEDDCKWVLEAQKLCTGGEEYYQKRNEDILKDVAESPREPLHKICCSCKPTKKYRDEEVMLKGPDHEDAWPLIRAHKLCLRDLGFSVPE